MEKADTSGPHWKMDPNGVEKYTGPHITDRVRIGDREGYLAHEPYWKEDGTLHALVDFDIGRESETLPVDTMVQIEGHGAGPGNHVNSDRPAPESLQQLLEYLHDGKGWLDAPIKDGYLDDLNLPTFGDNPPEDTRGLFSWDDDSILCVGKRIGIFQIEPRSPEGIPSYGRNLRSSGKG